MESMIPGVSSEVYSMLMQGATNQQAFDYLYGNFEAQMAEADSIFAVQGNSAIFQQYLDGAGYVLDEAAMFVPEESLLAANGLVSFPQSLASAEAALTADGGVAFTAAEVAGVGDAALLTDTALLTEEVSTLVAVSPLIAAAVFAVAGLGYLVYELVTSHDPVPPTLDISPDVLEHNRPFTGPYAHTVPSFSADEDSLYVPSWFLVKENFRKFRM